MLLRAFSLESSVSDDFSDEYVNKDGVKPGTWGCHEALHMACFLEKTVREELVAHPTIQSNEAWKAVAEIAANTLFQLYQAIADKHLSA